MLTKTKPLGHKSQGMRMDGAADGNRTHDLRLTKASLYPLATAAVVSRRNEDLLINIFIEKMEGMAPASRLGHTPS